MRAHEQYHFPFRPVPDAIDLAKNDTEEKNLTAKPEHLHQHPEDEIRLEAHLANKRVAHHDPVNFEITSHRVNLFSGGAATKSIVAREPNT